MKQQRRQKQQPELEENSSNILYDRIRLLRETFVAVDFDVSLWDSLFSSSSAAAAAAAATTPSISSLSSVLDFLQLNDVTIIPAQQQQQQQDEQQQRDGRPAYLTLEELQTNHHGHLHDALLHSICMALANATSALYLSYCRETARSVQELEQLYDFGIGILTNINAMHLTSNSNRTKSTMAAAVTTTVMEEDEMTSCLEQQQSTTTTMPPPSIVTPTTSPLATGSDTELIVLSSSSSNNNLQHKNNNDMHHHHHKNNNSHSSACLM